MPAPLAFITVAILSASPVIQELQKSYESIQTIEAKFTQVYRSKRFGDRKSSGKVWLKKPGQMRWDYDQPKGKVMVADGKSLTLFDPDDNQAIVSPVGDEGDLPPPLSFLWGKRKLEEGFDVTKIARLKGAPEGDTILECLPKKPISNVSKIYLFVRESRPWTVTGTRVIDSLDGENEIRFSDLQTNGTVSAERFRFDIPKGAVRVAPQSKEN